MTRSPSSFVRRSILAFVLVLALATSARAGGTSVCSAVLYDDAELLKALPPRLVPIVESARFRTMLTNRDAAWAPLHRALDEALAHPGQRRVAKLGGGSVTFHFRRALTPGAFLPDARFLDPLLPKAPELVIDELKLGANPGGMAFLDFIAAELGWIAKARAAGALDRGLTITGRDVDSISLADLLASIGFRKSKWPGPQCYVYGVAGGVLGYVGGRVFFGTFDANDANGSIYDEQRKFYRDVAFGSLGGAGLAVASVCFDRIRRNYSIDFDPNGIAKKTDSISDGPSIPGMEPKPGEPAPTRN